jgi:hypothetical protein
MALVISRLADPGFYAWLAATPVRPNAVSCREAALVA